MTGDGTATVDRLLSALLRGHTMLGAREKAVAVGIYRLLARGRPVEPSELARVGQGEDVVRTTLGSFSEIRYENGRIVAFWGLDLRETAHRFEFDGHRLFTWCAWDPLFIAPILGKPARVESRCPVTDRTVSFRVGPDGVTDVSPPTAALSFPDACRVEGSVITSFCQFVFLFASGDAARSWVLDRPGTMAISIDQGFELGRRMKWCT